MSHVGWSARPHPRRRCASLLPLLLLITWLAGCSGEPAADVQGLRTQVDSLRSELDALRRGEQQSRLHRAGAQAAMQPLQAALEQLLQRQQADVARTASIAAEVQQLATLLQPTLGGSERDRVQKLLQRLGELEQDFAAQKQSRAKEQELILRALDATVDKLDVFLQQSERANAPTTAPSSPAGERASSQPSKSSIPGASLLWLAGGVAVTLLALWLARRGRGAAPAPVALEYAAAPSAPPASGPAPGTAGSAGPLQHQLGIPGPRPTLLIEPLRQVLGRDPEVLELPAPILTCTADRVDVTFWVTARGESVAHRVEAELLCVAAELARRQRGPLEMLGPPDRLAIVPRPPVHPSAARR